MFWYTASAVPWYQCCETRICGGRTSMKSPRPIRTDQPRRTWRLRLSALYCVRTKTRRKSLFKQLERVTSMMRYTPPKGTAGFARSRVKGHSRSPWPPARSTPSALRIEVAIRGFSKNSWAGRNHSSSRKAGKHTTWFFPCQYLQVYGGQQRSFVVTRKESTRRL